MEGGERNVERKGGREEWGEPENEGKEGGGGERDRSNLGRERGLGEDGGAGVRQTLVHLASTHAHMFYRTSSVTSRLFGEVVSHVS